MAYNKSKHLDAAQKHLHQGKIAPAIGEYLVILKHEPRDQVTLMTVGDLYVRQGETFQALEYFERLAQIFLSDGFITKAIAIYKKIAKLAPEEPRPVERLAELYVQQGVLSEARPIYLQLAELHLRAGHQPQAAAMLHKLLEAEPDNLRVQTRLADLLLAMNQPHDAAAAFRGAAQLLASRGEHTEAIEYAERALHIDAHDTAAQALKSRSLAGSGQPAAAIALLEAMPQLDAGGEPAEFLLDLYLGAGEVDRASDLAAKILARNPKHFAAAHKVADVLLESGEPSRALPTLDMVREAMTHAGEHEQLAQSLTRAAELLPGRVEPREWLVELFRGTSDTFRLPAALADLVDTYQAAGRHDDAKRTLEELIERDPDNDQAHRKYEQLRAHMGLGEPSTHRGSHEPPVEDPGPPKARQFVEPILDEETQRYVTQALTDVDLFSTYGLTQKAIDLLETMLQRAPLHAPTLERLLDLYLGAGDERRTAELAAQLQHLHGQRGDTAAADRFAELNRRFERAAGLAAPEARAAAPEPPPEFSVPLVEAESEPEPVPTPELAVLDEPLSPSEAAVHEVDLSEEWAAPSGELAEADDLPGADVASEPAASAERQQPDGIPNQEPVAASDIANLNEALAQATAGDVEAAPEYALELEAEPIALDADALLRELSAEFDDVLPSAVETAPSTPLAATSPEPVTVPAPDASELAEEPFADPLRDVFNEFRDDLGDLANGNEDNEDLETHYSLGIAYREMGLLEEAISEFQRVAKAKANGQTFRYAMQCCTLLGLAFIEKGEPAIAAMWYERALESPGLDQESVLALRYDLGVAQELAGDTSAARKSFSQVYGMNIDYRDVAERLGALGKGR